MNILGDFPLVMRLFEMIDEDNWGTGGGQFAIKRPNPKAEIPAGRLLDFAQAESLLQGLAGACMGDLYTDPTRYNSDPECLDTRPEDGVMLVLAAGEHTGQQAIIQLYGRRGQIVDQLCADYFDGDMTESMGHMVEGI